MIVVRENSEVVTIYPDMLNQVNLLQATTTSREEPKKIPQGDAFGFVTYRRDRQDSPSYYPRVNIPKTMERSTIFYRSINELSMAMFNSFLLN